MGMYCAIWQIADEIVEDLLKDPSIGKDVVGELKEYDEELPEGQKVYLDLGKSFDAINFLLSKKSANPFSTFLSAGGQSLEGINLGYDEVRYFKPSQTKEIQALSQVMFKDLISKISLVNMVESDIYGIDSEGQESEEFKFIEVHWKELQVFLSAAVKNHRGLLVCLF